MEKELQVQLDGRMLKFKVELDSETASVERFRVRGRNKTVVLQTNRRLFRAKGLKHRAGNWTCVEGALGNQYAMGKICDEIEKLYPLG